MSNGCVHAGSTYVCVSIIISLLIDVFACLNTVMVCVCVVHSSPVFPEATVCTFRMHMVSWLCVVHVTGVCMCDK